MRTSLILLLISFIFTMCKKEEKQPENEIPKEQEVSAMIDGRAFLAATGGLSSAKSNETYQITAYDDPQVIHIFFYDHNPEVKTYQLDSNLSSNASITWTPNDSQSGVKYQMIDGSMTVVSYKDAMIDITFSGKAEFQGEVVEITEGKVYAKLPD